MQTSTVGRILHWCTNILAPARILFFVVYENYQCVCIYEGRFSNFQFCRRFGRISLHFTIFNLRGIFIARNVQTGTLSLSPLSETARRSSHYLGISGVFYFFSLGHLKSWFIQHLFSIVIWKSPVFKPCIEPWLLVSLRASYPWATTPPIIIGIVPWRGSGVP